MKFVFAALIVLAAFAVAEDKNKCGPDCTYSLDNGVLTLSGKGYTDDFCKDLPPWWSDRDKITSVVVDKLSRLQDCSFAGLTKVTTVSIELKQDDGYTYGRFGERLFEGCSSLTSVTIAGDSYSWDNPSFNKEMFKGCSSLKSISIPSFITVIKEDAFTGSSLERITVEQGNTKFSSDESGVLFDSDEETLIRYPPAATATAYVIPSTVTTMNSDAFNDVLLLQTLTLSKEQKWEESAFRHVPGLKEFKLPSEGNDRFAVEDGVLFDSNKRTLYRYPPAKECHGVACKTYEIPGSVTNIDKYAFEGCSSLETLSILSGLYQIDETALDGCITAFTVAEDSSNFVVAKDGALLRIYNKMETEVVKFPAKSIATEYNFAHPDDTSVTSIRAKAFEGCTSLTAINIPTNVTKIDHSAFNGCTSLTAVNVVEGNSHFKSLAGVFFEGDVLVKYPAKKAGASYSIPTEEETGHPITEIASKAFEGCNLLTSVSIHKNITTIKDEAFKDCSSLATVQYFGNGNPGGLDSFVNCPKVGKVCVPEGYIVDLGFCYKPVRDCSKPEPGTEPTSNPNSNGNGSSSSAAVVLPSLAAVVVAVFALFF